MKFFVPGSPIAQGSMSVFNGRVVHSNGAKLKAWRQQISNAARVIYREPISGGVSVDMVFHITKPKTVTRSTPHVKPDLDKYVRACLDALTGSAFLDDAQVITLTASKHYSNEPGVSITVRPSV
jgi:crossover junction endodeoxyribonuclease RusA